MQKDILYPLRRLHGIFHEECLRQKKKREFRKSYQKAFQVNPRTVLLLMTPEHGNLGDHAIAMAIFKFLNDIGISWIEVTDRQLQVMQRENLLGAMNGFPILICGGGNMGTLWMNVENLMREVVHCNPKSSITILPNTAYYEESDWGKLELEKAKQIYNHHRKLRIYARERSSLEFMNRVFQDIELAPDMVLSMPQQGTEQVRQGCLLCLRADKEKTRTPEQEQLIRQQAQQLFGENVTDTDMVIPGSISTQQRESALQEKFREFSGAELVITDRLHGMIFCAITGTPCIVINSKSPKVRGCYEWIKHLEYIRFADDLSTIAEEYRNMPQAIHTYDNSHLVHYYEELANDILSIL